MSEQRSSCGAMRPVRTVSFLMAVLLHAMPVFAGTVEYLPAVMSGMPAPGGGTFAGGQARDINANGDVLVSASGTGVAGAWVVNSAGAASPMILQGDSVPDSSSGQFLTVQPIALSDDGYAGVYGLASDGQSGVWRSDGSTTSAVAIEGQTVLGTDPGIIRYINLYISFGSDGAAAFGSRFTPSGTSYLLDTVWVRDAANGLTPLARATGLAPGLSGGEQIDAISGTPTMTPAGKVSFFGRLTDGVSGVSAGVNDQVIWQGAPSDLEVVARNSDGIQGSPGLTLDSIAAVSIPPSASDDGVVFVGSLSGTGVTGDNEWAVLAADAADGPAIVLRQGDTAGLPVGFRAGTPDEVTLAADQLAILSGLAKVTTPSTRIGQIVWAGDLSGALSPLAVTGDDAGLEGGELFDGFSSLFVNNAGQVAFLASLSDGSDSIWATTPEGQLTLVAKVGRNLDLGSGYSGVVQSLMMGGLSDSGRVAFTVSLDNGQQGAAVAFVPEPATAVFLTLGGFLLSLRRRG